MEELPNACELTGEDLRSALRDLKGYIDVTEEDLMKIYASALRHAARRKRSLLSVAEVMTRDVVSIGREADLKEAARRLSGLRISGMPVVDENNRVIGVISEADILSLAGVRKGHTFKDVLKHVLGEPLPKRKDGKTVGEVMSTPPITTGPEADIREVASILDDRRIKRLPVVDGKGILVGVISRADIVRAMGIGTERIAPAGKRTRSRRR